MLILWSSNRRACVSNTKVISLIQCKTRYNVYLESSASSLYKCVCLMHKCIRTFKSRHLNHSNIHILNSDERNSNAQYMNKESMCVAIFLDKSVCTDWQLIQAMRWSLLIISVWWIDKMCDDIQSGAHHSKFCSLSSCWVVDKLSVKSFCCLKPESYDTL